MTEYKILVVGPSWIGDMVMVQSLLKFLHSERPGIIVDVLAPAWALPVVQRMPEVNKGIPFHSRHGKLDLLMRIKAGFRLKKESYDEAIIIPRSFKSMVPILFSGIAKRTAFKRHFGLTNNLKHFNKSREQLYVYRLLSLAATDAYSIGWEDIPKPRLDIDKNNLNRLLKQWSLAENQYVVFAPGAEFGPAKQWPATHFSELARLLELAQKKVVIMGSYKDTAVAESIITGCGASNMLDLTGKTTIPDVIDLMSAAFAVVANDSGLMHLGYASGSKVAAIYGSSSPSYTPPLSNNSIIFQHSLECRPCFARSCHYGHYKCLNAISAQQVCKAITDDVFESL